jgi:hypothetical protein
MAKAKTAKKKAGKGKAATAKVPSEGEATNIMGGLDLASMVGGKKKAGSKKPSKPQVQIDLAIDQGTDADGNPVETLLTDLYLAAIKKKKAGESEMADAFGELAPELEAERVKISRSTGKYTESLSVNHRLVYTVAHKYCGIDSDNAAELAEVFGAEDFKKYFRLDQQTSLNMAALESDPEFLKGLFELIVGHLNEAGKNPADVVEVKQVLKPTEALTQDRVMDPAIEAKFTSAQDQGLVTPAKAVLKEGK